MMEYDCTPVIRKSIARLEKRRN